MDNRQIAELLERVGELLAVQEASPFRVRAYRTAAQSLRELDRSAADILAQECLAGLEQLPHVGNHIARAIAELIDTGRLSMLERLEGELCPERLFASIPGIGPGLAHRIHALLQIETLEELELAAHDGRLLAMRGMGPRHSHTGSERPTTGS
jgi:DNA polymerase/3'-5' exonuclease PolX